MRVLIQKKDQVKQYGKKGKLMISETDTTYLSLALVSVFSNKASYCIRPEKNSEGEQERETPMSNILLKSSLISTSHHELNQRKEIIIDR